MAWRFWNSWRALNLTTFRPLGVITSAKYVLMYPAWYRLNLHPQDTASHVKPSSHHSHTQLHSHCGCINRFCWCDLMTSWFIQQKQCYLDSPSLCFKPIIIKKLHLRIISNSSPPTQSHGKSDSRLTWFAFQQILWLCAGDFRHSGEDMRTVHCRPLHAVAVVDLPVTGLLVQVELSRSPQKPPPSNHGILQITSSHRGNTP